MTSSEEVEQEEDLTQVTTSFGVITYDRSYQLVTSELGIEPTRFCQQGDQSYSRFSARPAVAQYGIWEIALVSTGFDPLLSDHIQHFQQLLDGREQALKRLKTYYGFERVFYVLVNTEGTVAGFELSQTQMEFITRVSDRFTYRVVSNVQIRTRDNADSVA